MKILSLVQGSEEWIAERIKFRTASEASMMMGEHKTTRNELLHAKATSIPKEFSAWVQRELLDKGHLVEAAARPIVEAIIDDMLFPITAVDDDDYLLASFDGRTDGRNAIYELGAEVLWECKSWNEAKAADVRNDILPLEDFWQVTQQLLVSQAEKLLYTVTDGTAEKMVKLWVYPNAGDFRSLMAGWEQFDIDLISYVPHEIKKAPVAEAVKELPAVTVHVKGELTLCNLKEIVPQFDKFIAGAITKFESDDDFANAEAQAKVARTTAKKCDDVAQSVIDQMLTVSDVIRTLREYRDKFNALGLQQEKAVKSEKQRIKESLIAKGTADFTAFLATIHAEIAPIQLTVSKPDFANAVKAKRTMESLHNAVDSELAQCKIKVNETALTVRTNLYSLEELAQDHKFLFNDLQQIIHTDNVSFEAIVENRIAKHEAEQKEKLEADRERIRKEEEAKARKKIADEAQAQADAEEAQAERERIAEAEKQQEQKPVEVESKSADVAQEKTVQPAAIKQQSIIPRPTNAEMVNVIASHYGVKPIVAAGWLKDAAIAA